MVEDGQMLVLGGLLSDDVEQTEEKVPLLGDLPVLGALFRYERTAKTKRNLMVFLRPVILRSGRGEQLTSSKYNYIRAEQLEGAERSRGRVTGEPVLEPYIPHIADGIFR
jgi:general secretion pathway protein D